MTEQPVQLMPVSYRIITIKQESYEAIDVDRFIKEAPLPFDVFLREDERFTPLFFHGTIFDQKAQTVLSQKGIRTVYAKKADIETFEDNQQKNSQKIRQQDFQQYLRNKVRYFPIDRALLVSGGSIPFSLFLLTPHGIDALLTAAENKPQIVTDSILHTEGELIIDNADIPLYQSYLDSLLTGSATGEREKLKRIAIKENSKLLIKGLLDNPRSGEKIKQSIYAVRSMVDCILANRDAISDLLSLKTYDSYTYVHSVNVATLSVGLGIAMGICREDVECLGIGAMLHDIGKSTIPNEILNKPGKLTDEEFKIMKTHVAAGEEILQSHAEIPEKSLSAVAQHHEKLSGNGYPRGCAGKELTIFGRITSLIDCYDAMTTDRPYQKACTPFYALSIITGEKEAYDHEIVSIFIRTLGDIRA